ncbi:hypothetical protein [Asticcacaulis sp. YBE204]|uniref:hypothetical protein n=1 Tax=Asticcacaulis sp. YBE204 TaxID=1282363 RepID=UPI0003C3C6AF|nr:hypothetical protein [Asticcacaulis sp. YBE204]ESQ76913.1 hypothetical protein AEYBE204_18730 [Asticcacaulis sp. YBE204]
MTGKQNKQTEADDDLFRRVVSHPGFQEAVVRVLGKSQTAALAVDEIIARSRKTKGA